MNALTPQGGALLNSPAYRLLARLAGVRDTGQGRWLAQCPSHADRSPSLSIRETDEGTLLVHCFAGCGAGDVMAAIGLSLAALFVDRPPERGSNRKGERRIPLRDVVEVVKHEILIVTLVATDIHEHREVDEATFERLCEAVRKINSAMESAA